MTTPKSDDNFFARDARRERSAPATGDGIRIAGVVAMTALIVLTIVTAKAQNDRLRGLLRTEAETLTKVESVLDRINQEVESLAVERRRDVNRILEMPSANYDAIMENRKLQEAIAAKVGLTRGEITEALAKRP